MSFEYDLPGAVTSSILTPSTSITSNTNTSILDLSPYKGAVAIALNAGANTAGDANAKLQATIYDSADNSSFAVSSATNAFTNVTNANSYQALDVDTRLARRYLKVVMNVYGVNTAYPVGLAAHGQKFYNPNAV